MIDLPLHHAHAWNVTPAQAVDIQRKLAALVRPLPLHGRPRTLAGVDVSVLRGEVQAAVVVLDFGSLELVAEARWRGPAAFPYVPGLLSFREIPAVLRALELLDALPDLIMADAHGVAHPRRMGMAAHLGVLLDTPVVGVAKSKLLGAYAPPADTAGAQTPLYDGLEQIGVVLRTRAGVKPLFVSVGPRITMPEAVEVVLATQTHYRMPEPTRRAHLLSRRDFT